MEKLINSNRYYFDYNATSPLANKVYDLLARGDFSFANASSIHTSGKLSASYIKETRQFLLKTFALEGTHRLFFHSGATEGAATVVNGYAKICEKNDQKLNFFYSECDHLAILHLVDELEYYGHKTHPILVDQNGDFNDQRLIEEIKAVSDGPVLLNYTYVNNETGVVWDLPRLHQIKRATNCKAHVDAVQSVGKVKNWDKLDNFVDSYSFSAHKFGALKGVGFTFVHKDFQFMPLLIGGKQEDGLRGGTLNTLGVYSVKLALEELQELFNYDQSLKAKQFLEESLEKFWGQNGEIIGKHSKKRNSNTITFVLKGVKADILSMAFDINGLDVGSGSACSSNTLEASKTLLAMGYGQEEAKGSIRLSFGPTLSMENARNYLELTKKILMKFI
ncbi:MAG: aminotransferase class V-fold PLP-dependent enzyme [Bacteriovoracaceae bacterium]|nr:aminotransferase class V-fold PLP-dependent enzyme [Bacteriovoracaceae bacterium]